MSKVDLAINPSFIYNDTHFPFIMEFCKALNMLCQVIDKYAAQCVHTNAKLQTAEQVYIYEEIVYMYMCKH